MEQIELNLDELVNDYNELNNLHKVAKKHNTSHLRISKLFKENGIMINNHGMRRDLSEDELNDAIFDYNVNHLTMEQVALKYKINIKRLRNIFKDNNVNINRWNGHITKEKIKSKKIIKVDRPFKKCPYCDWKTYDIDNKSHAYAKHILHIHNKTIEEHLEKYNEDEFYFEKMLNGKNKVICKECGKLLYTIDDRHLKLHNMTKSQYIDKYGSDNLISTTTKDKLHNCILKMYENKDWIRNASSYEIEIGNFLSDNNIDYINHDREVLEGLELDFLIKNIGIEFNGNKYHTEWFGGKTKNYHINKTDICNSKGINLLQIFEDEYVYKKHIVLSKISHILGIDKNLIKIMGRKCSIELINEELARTFLNEYHIQGFASSSIYLGAIYNNELIGVMTFKICEKNSSKWELNRFATNFHYICQGVGGKLFKFFIKNYNPTEVKSFADRRWTIDKDNNLYTKLGFELDSILKPDYKYYNEKVDKYKRYHKFSFRKNILSKKYNLPLSLTETEMVKTLGYDRIWDCGLFKYVWKKQL